METVLRSLKFAFRVCSGVQTEYVLLISFVFIIFMDELVIDHDVTLVFMFKCRQLFIQYFCFITCSCRLVIFILSVNDRWHAVACWTWDAQDETCGICRLAFDGCCPDCKLPVDDCPLSY